MERKYYLRGLGLGIAVTAVIMGILTSRDKTMTDKEIIARAKELGMVENTVLSDMNEEEETEPEITSAKPETVSDQAKTDKENDPDSVGDMSASETALQDRGTEDREEGTGKSDGIDQSQGESENPEGADKSQGGSGNPDGADNKQSGSGNFDSTEQSSGDTSKTGAGAAQEGSEESDNADRPQTGAQGSTSSVTVKTITISPGDGSHTVARKLAEAGIVSSADTFDEFLCQYGYDKKLRTGTFSIPTDAGDEQIARIVLELPNRRNRWCMRNRRFYD